MSNDKDKFTPKQRAVVLQKVKTGVKSAETTLLHNLASLRGIMKDSDTPDMDLSKLEARVTKILNAMQAVNKDD